MRGAAQATRGEMQGERDERGAVITKDGREEVGRAVARVHREVTKELITNAETPWAKLFHHSVDLRAVLPLSLRLCLCHSLWSK